MQLVKFFIFVITITHLRHPLKTQHTIKTRIISTKGKLKDMDSSKTN